jgi:hypothetical protein
MPEPQAGEDQSALEERILRRIPLEILAFSLVLALGSLFFFFGPRTALFIFAGGAFSAASFLWLKQTITRFFGRSRRKAVKSGLLAYLLRLVLIIGVFSIIILKFPGMILAFAAGFSCVVGVFFIEAVRAIAQMKQWKN